MVNIADNSLEKLNPNAVGFFLSTLNGLATYHRSRLRGTNKNMAIDNQFPDFSASCFTIITGPAKDNDGKPCYGLSLDVPRTGNELLDNMNYLALSDSLQKMNLLMPKSMNLYATLGTFRLSLVADTPKQFLTGLRFLDKKLDDIEFDMPPATFEQAKKFAAAARDIPLQ